LTFFYNLLSWALNGSNGRGHIFRVNVVMVNNSSIIAETILAAMIRR